MSKLTLDLEIAKKNGLTIEQLALLALAKFQINEIEKEVNQIAHIKQVADDLAAKGYHYLFRPNNDEQQPYYKLTPKGQELFADEQIDINDLQEGKRYLVYVPRFNELYAVEILEISELAMRIRTGSDVIRWLKKSTFSDCYIVLECLKSNPHLDETIKLSPNGYSVIETPH